MDNAVELGQAGSFMFSWPSLSGHPGVKQRTAWKPSLQVLLQATSCDLKQAPPL